MHVNQPHYLPLPPGFLRRWPGIHNHLQCSHKSRYRPVERQQPTGEMEKDKKRLGILSRYAVLAVSDRFRAFVSRFRAKFSTFVPSLRLAIDRCCERLSAQRAPDSSEP